MRLTLSVAANWSRLEGVVIAPYKLLALGPEHASTSQGWPSVVPLPCAYSAKNVAGGK